MGAGASDLVKIKCDFRSRRKTAVSRALWSVFAACSRGWVQHSQMICTECFSFDCFLHESKAALSVQGRAAQRTRWSVGKQVHARVAV